MRFLHLITACLAALCLCACALAADSSFNVKDFGAIGDGKADDTAAIQAALTKAKDAGRGASVTLPAGNYRVTKTLTIENCLLTGLSNGGWPADRGPMPTLLVDHTDGPCILALSAASLHGLNFQYDHKGQEARKFGPTVQLSGNGISITNLRIADPYEGIMADGTTNVGRLNIENVFIISARSCGVYVTNTFDIPTLRNIEVWNPADYSQEHCVGFKFGRNDEIRISNCFAFKCKIGFLFVKEKEGATWGGMTGCSVDFSVEGVVVEAAESVRITGGCLWAHATSLRVVGPGKVVVSGADLRSNGDAALIVRDCTSVTVTGCTIGKSGPNWPTVPAAKLEGGKSVLISGCTFDAFGPGIVVGKNMDFFSITGNVFQPSPFETLTDKSGPSATKMVANNLSKKIAPPQPAASK